MFGDDEPTRTRQRVAPPPDGWRQSLSRRSSPKQPRCLGIVSGQIGWMVGASRPRLGGWMHLEEGATDSHNRGRGAPSATSRRCMYLDSPPRESFKSAYWWTSRETKLQGESFLQDPTISIALGGMACVVVCVDAVAGKPKTEVSCYSSHIHHHNYLGRDWPAYL